MADDIAYVAQLLAAPIAMSNTQAPARLAPFKEHKRTHSAGGKPRNDASRSANGRYLPAGQPPRLRQQGPPGSSASRIRVTTAQKRTRTTSKTTWPEGGSSGKPSSRLAAAEHLLPRGCSQGDGLRLQCDWCDCQVGRGSKAWLTHAAGIQHRRQALSVQLYGSPGHMVVSQFELLPGGVPAAAGGAERVRLGAAGRAGSAACAAEAIHDLHMAPEQFMQLAERALAAVRLELRNHCSLHEYGALSRRFDSVEVHLRGILVELGASKSCTVNTTSPARVAAAAAVLQASLVQNLLISVDECVLSKPMLAALGYLARSLQNSPALETVSVSCSDGSAMLSCCERGHTRAMARFLHAARDPMAARCTLRSISVAVPQLPDSCPCHDKPLGSMQQEHERVLDSAVHALRGAFLEASQGARSAVAMALHPRCAEGQCNIHRLPSHLIKHILDLAGPPCAINWQFL